MMTSELPPADEIPRIPLDIAIRQNRGISDREIARRREAARLARAQKPGPIRRLLLRARIKRHTIH
jgi:hypothetical protein